MQHRAIETRYKGYRFRSRLEARWAVFFDTLGLKWEYEPEGFELPSGRYLPDFHLAQQGSYLPGRHTYGPWVEIKAAKPTALEFKLMEELCEGGSSYGLILWGFPGEEEWAHFHKEGYIDDCSLDGPGVYEHWSAYLSDTYEEPKKHLISRAVDAARSARFEHGESGARRG